MKLVLALSLLLFVSLVQAEDRLITCTPPTKNTDDSPLTDLSGFKLYGELQGRPKRELATATTCRFERKNLAVGVQEWQVTALSPSGESAPSAITSYTVVGTPPPTCPAQPPPESRPQACIAPMVGNWTQQAVWTSVPAPACWTQSWTPSEAAAGVCASPPALVTAGPLSYFTSGSAMTSVGHISAGLPCGPDTKTVGGVKFCRITKNQTDLIAWPVPLAATDLWARAK